MESATSQTVLVVDDERNIRRTLRLVLESEHYQVLDAENAEQGLALLESQMVDCVLLDLKLPGLSGLEALAHLRDTAASGETIVPVIVISGHGTVADAVQATRLGAFDFLEKPLDRERVMIAVRNALRQRRAEREVGHLRQEVSGRFAMIGKSPAMQPLFAQIAKVAPTRARVLITGDSGTGKELVARAIHDHSALHSGPFVKVNCAAIPPELIESELFGHEKGAFTGAINRKRGLFEVADGGTLMLDEIGDMSLAAQAKLLRVLQTGELTRVGGERPVRVDVRVIAATNKDLRHEVVQGSFREDLYFRLNVVTLHSPPLRERLDDLPEMVEHFVVDFCRANGFRTKQVDPAVFERLRRHDWPGNVRELKNVIERAVIMSEETIRVADLPPLFAEASSAAPGVDLERFPGRTLREFKDEVERAFLLQRLKEHDWNISRTATALGIERTNLHKKLKSFALQRE
ncbi:MAG: sigma-54-dependent Fis family transcriptional regulator [Proteobacteria bacterium]|nr:sigma-54-dependent Fis family transcriptional regulator [Pseudomonadota bacterium]